MKFKKKICILSNGLFNGGTDTFIVNLVRGLNKDKYDITIILSTTEDNITIRESEVIKAGAKISRTNNIKTFSGKIKHFVRLYQILKKGKYDVFHTNIDLFNGPNLFIAWLAGIPLRVCHSHNARQEREMIEGKKFSITIYQIFMKFLCWHFSNRRCGCSSLAMEFLFKHRWERDIHSSVINNGIDIEYFRGNIDRSNKKKEIQLSAKYNILTVGRLSAQKNPLFIVDIFSELCKIRQDCDLVWVGTGDLQSKILKRIAKKGIMHHVHMMGSRNDVNEIMQCCDTFLFPSAFEGLGIVLIEAQAAGLPCLTSADVVPKEVDCGACRFLSLAEPPKEWAQQLNAVLAGTMSLRVDECRLQEYSLSHMVQQISRIYE